MSDDPTLLDAVDALTLAVKVPNWQLGHEHTWIPCPGRHDRYGIERCDQIDCVKVICQWCGQLQSDAGEDAADVVKHRTDPPLLDQLRDLIASSMESGGQGRAARERIPIDVSALTLYEDIDGIIRAWLDDLGARPGKDITPAQALRSWYVLHAASPDRYDADKFRTITSWEAKIRDKLEPPTRIEITAPCPVCGKEFVNIGLKLANGEDDPDDLERVRVLNAVERESIEDSYALCTACETVWLGAYRMRALRIAIDDQARAS